MTMSGNKTNPSNAEGLADLKLVQRVLAGSVEARARFAERMHCVPRIVAAISSRRQARLTSQDVEDLAQDSLVKILEKLPTFRGHTSLEFWAHRFCYLQLMNWVRKRGHHATFASELSAEVASEDGPSASPIEPGVLALMLEQMNPREAESIRLRLFEQLDFDQIGALLDVPPATAKSRYYRGIRWLQLRLGETSGGAE